MKENFEEINEKYKKVREEKIKEESIRLEKSKEEEKEYILNELHNKIKGEKKVTETFIKEKNWLSKMIRSFKY